MYAETGDGGAAGLTAIDAMQAFGGDRSDGDLWMPYMLHATAREVGVDLVVPDAVRNVAYRYRWTPPA